MGGGGTKGPTRERKNGRKYSRVGKKEVGSASFRKKTLNQASSMVKSKQPRRRKRGVSGFGNSKMQLSSSPKED